MEACEWVPQNLRTSFSASVLIKCFNSSQETHLNPPKEAVTRQLKQAAASRRSWLERAELKLSA